MSPDGWAYHAREVAAGGEDYFLAAGEEPGAWTGRGAAALGLSGQVDESGLGRLFGEGRHPLTGAALGRPAGGGRAAVTGYAPSFSPPKSVSVLWALAPDRLADGVQAGHDAAVAAALDFLEDHACFTRRGQGGAVQERAAGYVAAAFTHRTSRSADPQLHTHVLVANRVRAPSDGRWLSLDGRELYEVQKAAGMLYKAALRAELTARLGLAWGEIDDDGAAEIAGVPAALIHRFATRRRQVEATAAGLIGDREAALGRSLTGGERAAVLQQAAYQSRAPKEHDGATTAEFRRRWRAEAAAAGHPAGVWPAGLRRRPGITCREALISRSGAQHSVDWAVAGVLESVERRHSTWGRAQLVEALTVTLPLAPARSAGAARAAVEAAAAAVLAHRDVVRLTPAPLATDRHGQPRYSTWWTLHTEQAILDAVDAGRHAGAALADTADVAGATGGLGPDQVAAVDALCRGGQRVAVMVGPAGAGKARALGAARRAWEAAGITVRGVAPSAVAAGVLTEQAGIPSDTLAMFLAEAGRGRAHLGAGEVVVCDEASMVSTRDLARLILVGEAAGAKVVLVGDHLQLGAVDAGGLFWLLAHDAVTAELTGVRRFQDPWEGAATLRLRDPSVLAEYAAPDRISGHDEEGALQAAQQAWLDARQQGRSVVAMAGDHETVDRLAMRARAILVAAGQVEAGGVTVGEQTVGTGNEVVTTRNDRRLRTSAGAWIRNGDRWQVTGCHTDDSLRLTSPDGRGQVTVPGDYVRQHVALAYAVTIHKAQGVTVDEGILLAGASTTAEQLYVGMTRGRQRNQALVVVTERRADEHQPARAIPAHQALGGPWPAPAPGSPPPRPSAPPTAPNPARRDRTPPSSPLSERPGSTTSTGSSGGRRRWLHGRRATSPTPCRREGRRCEPGEIVRPAQRAIR